MINRHMGSVNLSPIDIPEEIFEVEENIQFDPSFEVKMLKKIIAISNSNLVKNADALLSARNVDGEVDWFRKDKKRLPENRFKMFYWILVC